MNIAEKVKAVLMATFPEASRIELHEDDGLIGILVSERFEGMEGMERVDVIWDVLDQSLTAQEKRQILTIVAVTSLEYAGHMSAV